MPACDFAPSASPFIAHLCISRTCVRASFAAVWFFPFVDAYSLFDVAFASLAIAFHDVALSDAFPCVSASSAARRVALSYADAASSGVARTQSISSRTPTFLIKPPMESCADAIFAPASAEQIAKDVRDRRREAQALPRHRMGEAEELRVQAEAAERVRRRAVELVARHRMPGLGQMRADLVLPPRLQRHLQHRVRVLHLDRA